MAMLTPKQYNLNMMKQAHQSMTDVGLYGEKNFLNILNIEKPTLQAKLYNLIVKYYIEADKVRGITSHIASNDSKSDFCYSRDASKQIKTNPKQDNYIKTINHICMGLNYLAALVTLLEAHNIKFNHSDIIKIADNFQKPSKTMLAGGSKLYFLSFVQHTLAPLLVEKGICKTVDKAIKALDKSKDWVALELPSMHILTQTSFSLIDGQQKNSVRIDSPITRISSELKKEFTHYERHQWFSNLSKYEKQIFEKHYKKLLLKGRVIPSQLRTRIPGLKNAYHSQDFILNENDIEHAEKIADYFHCGALPYVGGSDKESLRTAAISARQLHKASCEQQDPTASKPLTIMVTLNSRLGDILLAILNAIKNIFSGRFFSKWRYYKGYDRRITLDSRKATQQIDGMHSSNLCLNVFRHIERNETSGTRKAVKLARQTEKKLRNIEKNLHNDGSKSYQDKIDQLKLWQEKLNISRKKINFKIYRPPWHRDRNVRGDYIVSELQRLSLVFDEIRDNIDETNKASIPSLRICFGCASGNNRTMIAKTVTDTQASRMHVNGVNPDELSKRLTGAGHVQLLPGFQGGNAGMTGIRYKSIDSVPFNYNYSRHTKESTGVDIMLTSDCADMKSALYDIKKLQKNGGELIDKSTFDDVFKKHTDSLFKIKPKKKATLKAVEAPIKKISLSPSSEAEPTFYDKELIAGVSTKNALAFAVIACSAALTGGVSTLLHLGLFMKASAIATTVSCEYAAFSRFFKRNKKVEGVDLVKEEPDLLTSSSKV